MGRKHELEESHGAHHKTRKLSDRNTPKYAIYRYTSSPTTEKDMCETSPSSREPERTRFATFHPKASTNYWNWLPHSLPTKEKRWCVRRRSRGGQQENGVQSQRRQPHFARSSHHLPQELGLDLRLTSELGRSSADTMALVVSAKKVCTLELLRVLGRHLRAPVR